VAAAVQLTLTQAPTAAPSVTPTLAFTPTGSAPETTLEPTSTPTITPTPLPAKVALKGVKYQDQHGLENFCAPANLAMALSYWGVNMDRLVVGKGIKPMRQDKNVMPYEMEDFVETQTGLQAVVRVGGDLDLLKRFIAEGYPVLLELGKYMKDLNGNVTWMGHYQVLTGYDEAKGVVIAQDSFFTPDYPVPYDELIAGWRSFNYIYLVIYPPEQETAVMAILGTDADETANNLAAAERASREIYEGGLVDQYFAWFNRGTNLVRLQDFGGAAAAYDQASAIYATIPEKERPYRMLWYQTGPYFAYYYTGRYYDIISLATLTLKTITKGVANLEESYYWRARAYEALGDLPSAIDDLETSLKYHPGFAPSVEALTSLGVEP